MTSDEWFEVVEWVRSRWDTRVWTTERAAAVYTDFAPYAQPVVLRAAKRIYRTGQQTAPSPSVLLAAATAAADPTPDSTIEECDPGGHRYAVTTRIVLPDDRYAVCVRCNTEKHVATGVELASGDPLILTDLTNRAA